jgi:hypothetical protein
MVGRDCVEEVEWMAALVPFGLAMVLAGVLQPRFRLTLTIGGLALIIIGLIV